MPNDVREVLLEILLTQVVGMLKNLLFVFYEIMSMYEKCGDK